MTRILKHYNSCKTAFLCCDIQEKLKPFIPNFANCIFVANRYAELHNAIGKERGLFIVTEHYSKGLGPTCSEIQLPSNAYIFQKTQNSMLIPEVIKLIDIPEIEQIILWGCEAHACILQTVDSLLNLKKKVFLSIDGCGSRTEGDFNTAIELIRTWSNDGCLISTSESMALQLLRDAKDPLFKTFLPHMKVQYPVKF